MDDLFEDEVVEDTPESRGEFGDIKKMADYNREFVPAPTIVSNTNTKKVEAENMSAQSRSNTGTNKVTLNLNLGKFTNLLIELNDMTPEGKLYIKERIEMANKYVEKYGYKEGQVN